MNTGFNIDDLFDLLNDVGDEATAIDDSDNGGVVNSQQYLSIAQSIFELSQLWCPVDTGALRSSGKIVENSLGTYSIKYSTPYAVHVHEIMENRHKAPTRAKWLEDAAYDILNQYESNGSSFTFSIELTDDSVVLHLNSLSQDDFDFNRGYGDYVFDNIFGSDTDVEPMRKPEKEVRLFD